MLRKFVLALTVGLTLVASTATAQQRTTAPAHNHAHGHGPHNGDILEIGQHDFHAELCLDEQKKQTTIYILDKALKNYVAIDAPALLVNVKIAGKPMQIKLPAIPQKSDAEGKSSCFAGISPDLMNALHDANSDARISLRVGDKNYVVKVVHHHNHNHATNQSTQAPKKR